MVGLDCSVDSLVGIGEDSSDVSTVLDAKVDQTLDLSVVGI
jgi:hypothetical protein